MSLPVIAATDRTRKIYLEFISLRQRTHLRDVSVSLRMETLKGRTQIVLWGILLDALSEALTHPSFSTDSPAQSVPFSTLCSVGVSHPMMPKLHTSINGQRALVRLRWETSLVSIVSPPKGDS